MKAVKDKKQVYKIASALLGAFSCVMLCVLLGNVVRIANLNRKKAALESDLTRLEASYEVNEGKIRFLESDEFVEKYAREYLNLSGDGDENYEGR